MKEQSILFRKGTTDLGSLIRALLLWLEEHDVLLTLSRPKKERSNLQNRALWGCAYKAIRKATGNDTKALHFYFCGEYFGWDFDDVMGEQDKKPKRTTTTGYDGKRDVITTAELSDFYAFIQQRSAERVGVFVPDPDPRWWTHTESKAA